MIFDWGRSLIFYSGILCVGLLMYFLNRKRKKGCCDNNIRNELLCDGNKTQKEIISNLLFFINALPLLIYFPFILGAVAMGLAAMYDSTVIDLMKIIMGLWMFFILAYPLTYITCWIYYFKKGKREIIVAFLPLIHIFIVLIPFFLN